MPLDPTAILVQALELAVTLTLPAAAAAWIAGAVASALAHQIGAVDPVVPAVPRLAAGLLALAATGPWIAARSLAFGQSVLALAFG